MPRPITNLAALAHRQSSSALAADHFTALVVRVVGNQVAVRRPGYSVTETYPSARGVAATLMPGDVVYVQAAGGSYHVAYAVDT